MLFGITVSMQVQTIYSSFPVIQTHGFMVLGCINSTFFVALLLVLEIIGSSLFLSMSVTFSDRQEMGFTMNLSFSPSLLHRVVKDETRLQRWQKAMTLDFMSSEESAVFFRRDSFYVYT